MHEVAHTRQATTENNETAATHPGFASMCDAGFNRAKSCGVHVEYSDAGKFNFAPSVPKYIMDRASTARAASSADSYSPPEIGLPLTYTTEHAVR